LLLLLLCLLFLDLLLCSSSSLAKVSRSRSSSSRVFRRPRVSRLARIFSGSSSYSDSEASTRVVVMAFLVLGDRFKGAGGAFLDAPLNVPEKEAAVPGGLAADEIDNEG
jgi:hypothetical protein